MAYFERTGASSFVATEHTGGAWVQQEQHIAPALGLLAHVVETDRGERRPERPEEALALARLSFDILGTLPVADVDTTVTVLRPGRTIELVEATLSHGGRPAVILRAWLLQSRDTATIAGTATGHLPSPEATPAWDPTTVWPGGFIQTAHLRRTQIAPGRAQFWVRTDEPLVADEPVSPTAAAVGLLDIANGMTVRQDPTTVAFPNVDLTAHLVRAPRPGWLGFDTTVTFGDNGVGLTSSVLHDENGLIGSLNQILTVRPS
ncbi:thioesterase family protein [Knoellia sp. Soil729]|uniref:thioesterase family protein n=1 Tax=Knoellia sp. Soil729 TaxID=1736394 RepID=UPI0006F635E8|nr:thioesterase family protein [Knoellia sp. Soil729]KRE42931.1 thioesterase [Knoellia sp. Soil729]